MERIKNFKEFINENIFTSDKNVNFFSRLGNIITGKKSETYVTPPTAHQENTGESPIDSSSSTPSVTSGPLPNSIVIGDSTTPYVAKGAGLSEGPKAKSISVGGGGLWFGGISVGTLLKFANEYKNTDRNVKNVIVTIGTNGAFTRSTKTVKDLITRLKSIFPNAKILVVKGTYGPGVVWSKPLQRVSKKTVDDFYSDFSNNGAAVMPTPIGNVADCHGHLPVYKTIGKEIQQNLKR